MSGIRIEVRDKLKITTKDLLCWESKSLIVTIKVISFKQMTCTSIISFVSDYLWFIMSFPSTKALCTTFANTIGSIVLPVD